MSGPAPTTGPVARAIGAALRRPAVRAAWTALRDAWWELRRWRRPAVDLPASPRTLLFVCQGNICRSPFAAERAAALLRTAGRADIACVSAGYAPSQDIASPPHAVATAARYEVDLSRHRPSGLGVSGDPDVVFVMEERQVALVAQHAPQLADRVRLLPAYRHRPPWGYRRLNIPDPFGQPLGAFERCYADIEVAVQGLVDRLAPARQGEMRSR